MKILFKYILITLLFNIFSLADTNITTSSQLEANSSVIMTSTLSKKIIIDKVPEIKLNITLPVNYTLILLPIITIIIVIFGALITLRQIKVKSNESIQTFNKTIEEQTQLSKIEILSKNRQDWINILRDEFVSFIDSFDNILVLYTLAQKSPQNFTAEHLNLVNELLPLLNKNIVRITLLLNNTEKVNKDLFIMLGGLRTELFKVGKLSPSSLEQSEIDSVRLKRDTILKLFQMILKKEWEILKTL